MKRTTQVNRILKDHAQTLAIHKATQPSVFDRSFAHAMGEEYEFPETTKTADSLGQPKHSQKR